MQSIVESMQYRVRSAQESPTATISEKSVVEQRKPQFFILHSSLFTSEENR